MTEDFSQILVCGLSLRAILLFAILAFYAFVLFRVATPGSMRISSSDKDGLRGSLRIRRKKDK